MSPFDRCGLHDEIRKEIERAGPFGSCDLHSRGHVLETLASRLFACVITVIT
jgi:hypothetical protein